MHFVLRRTLKPNQLWLQVSQLSLVSFSLSLSFERFEKEKWKKHFSENKKEFVSFYSISIYIDLFAFKLIIREKSYVSSPR